MPCDLDQLRRIKQYFGKTIAQQPTHPLAKQLQYENREYLAGFEAILAKLESTAGFKAIIRDCNKNSAGFYNNVTTLQFCELLKESEYSVDQLFANKGDLLGGRIPDIKFRKSGSVAYAECKHSLSQDQAKEILFEDFEDFSSMFNVWVSLTSPVYTTGIRKLAIEIQNRIRSKEKNGDITEEKGEINNLGKYQLYPKEVMKRKRVILDFGWRGSETGQKIRDYMDDAKLKFARLCGEFNYLFIKSDDSALQSHAISNLLCGSDGMFHDRAYGNIDSVVFVDWKNDVYEYQNPSVNRKKIIGELFHLRTPFPLSEEWLKKEGF